MNLVEFGLEFADTKNATATVVLPNHTEKDGGDVCER